MVVAAVALSLPAGAAVLPSATGAAAPRATDAAPSVAAGGWSAPVGDPAAPDVLAPFDPPAQDWLPGHRGVDLTAPPGDTVRSPAGGTVTFAGPVAGRDVLVVTHDDGLRTSLEPVTSSVSAGTRVRRGDVVGHVQDPVGTAGSHCAGTCVHWGVRRERTYLDPLGLLGGRPPIVLLPLRERGP
ncbi:M23 family metallopeptidase [Cellulosimicrobium arenosum]|uniref:M23 family metallopeptidase n=1 Tax=Cellulosimicrobium arenosum TaxID=2708133 RepID=A0A927G982_9MICO|nr:M23 family metallopeptidase [Cellulosimicrobium arenosum]